MWTVPQVITQGDRLTWTQNLEGYSPNSDTLACFIRGETALDLTGVPNGEGWDFTILETQSAVMIAGNYKAQFVIFATGQGRKTLGSTNLLVCLSFENLTELDPRSDDQKELELITTAIARLTNGAVAEYRIGDRMMRYQDLAALTQRQQYLRNRIAKIKNPKNIGGRNVGVRFSNP